MLKDIRKNPLLLTDAYNFSHQRLKVNTDWEVSHIYNRKEGMILYGFSEIVNSVLNIQITNDMLNEAIEVANKMGLNFPRELFERVINECNGYFPIEVQSLPEGCWCPIGTPFAQVRNTEEGYGECVTWLEGIFLHASFPCGTATEAFHMRRYLNKQMKDNGFDDSHLLRLHSFGFRGNRSLEDSYWASTSWNLFLHGTDDVHSMIHTPNAKMSSISALAHKVTQQFDDEYEGYIHTIDATAEADENIVAIVIDTYDADRFIDEYLVPLSIYACELGVHLVIRPDSGDVLDQVTKIWYKVQVNEIPNVTTLIGEGMNFANVKRTDLYLKMRQIPLSFVSYGIGGGFYNHINRDTLGFAMKTAYSNGKPRMKFSMDEIKRSIPDAVDLHHDEVLYVTRESSNYNNDLSVYKIIYTHTSGHSTPISVVADWDRTKNQATLWLDEEELQERIVLDDSIKELVKEFEEIYG